MVPPPPATQPLTVLSLGRTRYAEALAVQRRVHEQRRAGLCGDTLILTEHKPVLTLGRGADTRHIRVDPHALSALGLEVVHVERGGDVTYHGPGQLVAYPIVDLRAQGRNIRRYVRALEAAAITLLAEYGVTGERRTGTPGVWVGERKIASIGVYIREWVTLHGIAINIDPHLAHFDLIHPCGLVGMLMTSLAVEHGQSVSMADAEARFVPALTAALASPPPTTRV